MFSINETLLVKFRLLFYILKNHFVASPPTRHHVFFCCKKSSVEFNISKKTTTTPKSLFKSKVKTTKAYDQFHRIAKLNFDGLYNVKLTVFFLF